MEIKRLLNLLKKCRSNINPFIKQNIAFIVLSELVVLLSITIPLIIRFLIDNILTDNKWHLFPTFIIVMGITIILSRILCITTNIIYNRFSACIEEKARNSLFSFVIKKDLAFFSKTGDGEIIDRLMRSPDQLHAIPSLYLERLLSSLGTLLAVFVILFIINLKMAIASLIAVPIFLLIYLRTRKIFFKQVQKAREESSKLTDFYTCTLRNVKQIKNLGSEEDEQQVSAQKNQNMKNLSLKFSITGSFVDNAVQMVTQLNQLGILIYGALQIYNGQMTIGTLVAFYSYLDLLYQPLISIIQTFKDINNSLVSIERYLEYYNHDHEEDYNSGKYHAFPTNDIIFDNVSFSYDQKVVFEKVCIQIKDGEKVLLSGKSGIGKSTLVSLIKRFYSCQGGTIKIGGININDYRLVDLRRNIMYITQDDYFYPVSIRENFLRINPSLSDPDIVEALKKAQLFDDIFSPGKSGLETTLEKNGITLSGGQRRRMSLALLFASHAPIVILDEPFSGLDEPTRIKLWKITKDYLSNKTVIVIDHNFTDSDFFDKTFEVNATNNIAVYNTKKGELP